MTVSRNIRFFLNDAKLIAQTTAIAYGKALMYRDVLAPAIKTGSADYCLSLDNNFPENSTAGPAVKRNNIILKSFDDLIAIELIAVDCDVIPTNTIVETAVVGRAGTVKEFISAQDHKVNIKGIIISDSNDSFPLVEQIAFKKILETERRMQVESVYLNLWGITKLVYKSGSFKPSKKYVNAFEFKLQCVSDQDFSLYVEE